MYNLEKITEEVDEILTGMGKKRDFPIRISTRMRTTYGQVRWENWWGDVKEMVFSQNYLNEYKDNDYHVHQTILHEVCHVICGPKVKHRDAAFKECCTLLGVEGEHHRAAVADEMDAGKQKWEINCPSCGKTVASFARMTKKRKAEVAYGACPHCYHPHLEVIKNW